MTSASFEMRWSEESPTIRVELPEEAKRRIVEVGVSWDIIDHATKHYMKTLQEYNIAEIVKAIVEQIQAQNKRQKLKNVPVAILPMAGNLDLNDPEVGFHSFIVALEKHRGLPDADLEEALKPTSASIVSYLLSGKHTKKDKQFQGWKRSFTGAKKALIMGILSVDIPKEKSPDSYVCGGTQHYISFVYIKSTNELVLFDSASKDPIQDHTEAYYILKYTFQELFAPKKTRGAVPDPPIIRIIPFKHVLQLGAGDRTTEDPYSYNNQNVFCHTWSMWFLTVFYLLFNETARDETPTTQTRKTFERIANLAKKQELFNLAMIKRFAQWLLPYIYDPEMASPKFRARPYENALKKGDHKTLEKIYESYLLTKDPMVGLSYIYVYSTKTILPIEKIVSKGKLAMDFFERIPLSA